MNDDCGQCPMCGEALIISKNNKLLYECSNAKCNYVEFLYHNADKGKKFAGGKKMDITEKWNKIVDHYTENINTPECDIQKAWVDFFADTDFFGYSKFNKEVDDQRSIQIGSTQRVIPDIIIRSNQEQHDLFVVELKRYSKMEGHSQLFSYLKLLNLNIGVLVCSKLYIYDYDIVNNNDEQAFIEIAFEKDNPDGIKFMELFSKSTFNQQEVKDYIQKRNKEMKNIHTIQQKVTTDYVKKLLQEHLAATYSQTEIEQAFKEINVTVEQKTFLQQPSDSVFSPPSKSRDKCNTPILDGKDPYPNMKIGEIAKQILRNRLSKGISEQELMNLQNAEYSKQFLGVNYPVLAKSRYVNDKNGNLHSRYYAKQVKINNKLFFLCSEWYETPANNDRPYLINWLKTHQ